MLVMKLNILLYARSLISVQQQPSYIWTCQRGTIGNYFKHTHGYLYVLCGVCVQNLITFMISIITMLHQVQSGHVKMNKRFYYDLVRILHNKLLRKITLIYLCN